MNLVKGGKPKKTKKTKFRGNKKRIKTHKSKKSTSAIDLDSHILKVYALKNTNELKDFLRMKDLISSKTSNNKLMTLTLFEKGDVSIYLTGLQYCKKEPHRIKQKINRKIEGVLTNDKKLDVLMNVAKSIKDYLRFTFLIKSNNNEKYSKYAKHIHNFLTEDLLELHEQHIDKEIKQDHCEINSEKWAMTKESKWKEWLYNTFKEADLDNSNSLSSDEFHEFMKGKLGVDPMNLFKLLDKDKNNSLSSSEFCNYQKGASEKLLEEMNVIKSFFLIDELIKEKTKLLNDYSTKGLQLFLHSLNNVGSYLSRVKTEVSGGGKNINRWNTNEAYKGINSVYRFKKNPEILIEIQYHTISSLEVKTSVHDMYEKTQLLAQEIQDYNRNMLKQYSEIPKPERIANCDGWATNGKPKIFTDEC